MRPGEMPDNGEWQCNWHTMGDERQLEIIDNGKWQWGITVKWQW